MGRVRRRRGKGGRREDELSAGGSVFRLARRVARAYISRRKVEHAVERKTSLICRCRPFRGLALALFALFGGLATAAQAMLLTLDLRWTGDLLTYKLQEGSIIQVIGYHTDTADDPGDSVTTQFGDKYGVWSGEPMLAEPSAIGNTPMGADGTGKDVYLADNTQTGHTILYTGAIQDLGEWYGLYTQITVDYYLYNTVYIRVFGAQEIPQGDVVASYWGIGGTTNLNPNYQTDELDVRSDVSATTATYFEVIPEPATVGLLGVGGVALAAWRRRRFARPDGDGAARLED